MKNFASVEVHHQSRELVVFVKVDPTTITLEPGFTRDVRSVGHYGTGDLEIRIKNTNDLDRAEIHLRASYDAN